MNPLREKMKNKKNLYIFVTYCIEKKSIETHPVQHDGFFCGKWAGLRTNDVKEDAIYCICFSIVRIVSNEIIITHK